MKRAICLLLFALIASIALADASFQVTSSTVTKKVNGRFNSTPAMALNTKTGNTLVIWERRQGSAHSILAKLLNDQGKRASAVFTLVNSQNISHPALAYNPDRNEFLLTFDNNPDLTLDQTNIFALRLNAKGKAIGTASILTTDSVSSTMANFLPLVVYNHKTSRYVAAWIREVTPQIGPGTDGLVAAQIDPVTVKTVGDPVLLRLTTVEQLGSSISLLIPIPLDVEVQPTTGKVMVGFIQKISGTNGENANYFAGGVAPDLSNGNNFPFTQVNGSPVNVTNSFVWSIRFAFASNGRGLVVFVDSTKLRLRKISGGGSITGPARSAFKRPKQNTRFFFPNIVFTTGSHGTRAFLIAVQNPFDEGGETTIWSQVLDGSGQRLGRPVKIQETNTTTAVHETAISVLPHPEDSETYPILVCFNLSGFHTPGQTLDGSGIILLNIKINF